MSNYSIKNKVTYIKEMNLSEHQLEEIVLNDEDFNARKAALKKIIDEVFLKQVALDIDAQAGLEDCDIRLKALYKLTNQDYIKEIAINGKYWLVRDAAVKELDDEELLLEVVNNCNDIKLIISIINKLSIENIKRIKSSDWYINAICYDILSNN